jgi:hypothetical protein
MRAVLPVVEAARRTATAVRKSGLVERGLCANARGKASHPASLGPC